MNMPVSVDDVFSVKEHNFNDLALEIFQHQAKENHVYGTYLNQLGIPRSSIKQVKDIPYLPIEFFKTHQVITGEASKIQGYFESSSTTGQGTSKHYYNDISWYKNSFQKGFEREYGSPENWCILALLPSYLERSNSSLIRMVDALIDASHHPLSGFYLYNHDQLLKTLESTAQTGQPTLLFGVSFALLDFASQYRTDFDNLTIIETGGMKGRRKEMIRAELHEKIRTGFGNIPIHSEYGMTELFSQAYATDGMHFTPPPWMKVTARELDDPLTVSATGRNGLIRVMDLANIQTCSFIATSDIGKCLPDGRFEVLGRFDHSEQRGCNLLVS